MAAGVHVLADFTIATMLMAMVEMALAFMFLVTPLLPRDDYRICYLG
jgi:hypothetical protein